MSNKLLKQAFYIYILLKKLAYHSDVYKKIFQKEPLSEQETIDPGQQNAFNFFERNIKSIEIVFKDNQNYIFYFPFDINFHYLNQEMKMNFRLTSKGTPKWRSTYHSLTTKTGCSLN